MKIPIIKYAPDNDKRTNEWIYYDEAKIMAKFIKDGDIILDVGSNVCDHSIFFALNFPNSQIKAFEPVAQFRELAVKNIEYNKVGNIEILPFGLGDSESTLPISINNEGSTLVGNHNTTIENIQIKKLDNIESIKRVDVIKMDVEGYEFEAIQGMSKLLASCKPKLLLEVHPQFTGSMKSWEIFVFLKTNNYFINWFNGGMEMILTTTRDSHSQLMEKQLRNSLMGWTKQEYEKSKTCEERMKCVKTYNELKYFGRPIAKWLLWSKLYKLFA